MSLQFIITAIQDDMQAGRVYLNETIEGVDTRIQSVDTSLQRLIANEAIVRNQQITNITNALAVHYTSNTAHASIRQNIDIVNTRLDDEITNRDIAINTLIDVHNLANSTHLDIRNSIPNVRNTWTNAQIADLRRRLFRIQSGNFTTPARGNWTATFDGLLVGNLDGRTTGTGGAEITVNGAPVVVAGNDQGNEGPFTVVVLRDDNVWISNSPMFGLRFSRFVQQ